MIHGFSKRTTFLVGDARDSARFYMEVFGWEVWYDNTLPVDHRFPPSGPDGADAHLIMLKAHDPKIGMVGFLSYIDHRPAETPDFRSREQLRLGDTILVLEATDLDATYRRAEAAGARMVSAPARWTVPGPDGAAIELYAMSMFDPQGVYSETSQSRS
jgi:catechol 2,3-dioxygenase-like lactoylglutathione lyase family enzyme